ncbi:DUF805 domain-containing protein [Devosia nitrariae]|nr:DUF805 domain-containing protein [Devosia nitrariae]
MDWTFLFGSFEGRISRKTFWIGTIILAVALIALSFLVLPLLGLGMMNPALPDATTGGDAQAIGQQFLDSASRAGWANLVVVLIFAYPMMAVMLKRRHDRNSPGWDVYAYIGLLALLSVLQGLGLCFTVAEVNGMLMPTPTLIGTIVPAIVGLLALYLLVVMGFLKGDSGANAYGPDPLGGTASATA